MPSPPTTGVRRRPYFPGASPPAALSSPRSRPDFKTSHRCRRSSCGATPTSPFRAKERRRWERILTDQHTVIVDGAGHFVQSDAPEEFATAIRDWRFAPGGRLTPPARGHLLRTTPRES